MASRRSHDRPRVDVLYVSTSPSPREFARMAEAERAEGQRVVYGLPEASFKFHNLLRQGFAHDDSVRVHSVVSRPIASSTHAGRIWRRQVDDEGGNYRIDHVGVVNLPGVKQVTAALGCAARTARWRWRTRRTETRILVLDGAYVTAMPGVLAALAGARVVRVGIFCDVYSYMADVTDAADRSVGAVHATARRVTAAAMARLQVFVLLTAAMTKVLPTEGRRVLVMEGLVDHRSADGDAPARSEHPTVLYAGALKEEYGLRDLLEGFEMYDDPAARLVVYGRGDFSQELESATDPRVEFRGAVSIDEVVEQEKRAWLLVNPRPTDREFTLYSFPSKTMEYLASGSPVLTTRLAGMPDEYYEFVWTIDRPGPEGVAEALARVFEHPPSEFDERGAAGKEFVTTRKNNIVQARRIVDTALTTSANS